RVRLPDGGTERIPAERVFALTGYHPDFALFDRIGIGYDDETGRADINPETLESNVPGVYLAGSVSAGYRIGEVFIENGRFDGEKIFGGPEDRRDADLRYASDHRPAGE
ncbi:MAG TPA: NAD(P)-binding domain-containing protein, partial [Gemmatimonadales bacterium]|nr:NAD(P)-binding domain-containing protein [Gemmatimonadales bacterium]